MLALSQSAKLNGHNPYAYPKDVLPRLPKKRIYLVGQRFFTRLTRLCELNRRLWQAAQHRFQSAY